MDPALHPLNISTPPLVYGSMNKNFAIVSISGLLPFLAINLIAAQLASDGRFVTFSHRTRPS